MTLEIDWETRSRTNLKTKGVWLYMRDPSTDALLASYRIDGGPMRRWRRGEPCPQDIVDYVTKTKGLISAHNAAFERLLWQLIMTPRYGWPEVTIDRFRCTQATASALALPRALENLGTVLKLDTQKDKAGEALIKFFSMPRRDGLFNEPEDHPEKFNEFHDYCDRDVLTEAAADDVMIPLSDFEQSVYTLDQIINDRGIRIDRRSALAAIRLAEKTKAMLDAKMKKLTKGAIKRCTEVEKLTAWVADQGVEMNSMAKADILELLAAPDLPDHVKAALQLRQKAAKTSVTKLKQMLARADTDGRVRHSFLYHKASPGRWQSVGVNFNNMPRPRKEYDNEFSEPPAGRIRSSTALLFEAFRTEDPDFLEALYGPVLGSPLDLISDAVRGFVMASPGHELYQVDFSSIEGCVIAWTSGEDWKVKALHEIFADPSLPDMYRRAAAGIMNTTTDVITKKHPLRQSVGKVSELALGYGGGVSAFYSMSRNYNVDLAPLFAPVWETASEEAREKACKRFETNFKRKKSHAHILPRESWIACELIKVGWRKANPKIAAGWTLREQAIRQAISSPGTVVDCLEGMLRYVVKHGFLWALLPSGRCLAYARPKLRDEVWVKILCEDGTWSEPETMDRELAEKLALRGQVQIQGDSSPSISVLGLDKTGKKMQREKLYGGIIAENDTQAIARDVLVNGMFEAEAEGYPIIGHVYDELFAERKRGTGSVEELEKIVCRKKPWMMLRGGLPLSAGGWAGKRYRKE